jgi:SAM-dependent methyltransferase
MLEANAQCDLITTFDAIHDQAHPDKVLARIGRALRPDGIYLMQDIIASSHLQNNLDHPIGPFLYAISCMHCMTVSLALNGIGLAGDHGSRRPLVSPRTACHGRSDCSGFGLSSIPMDSPSLCFCENPSRRFY